MLPFAVQPDLAATMDIQIPALAWQRREGETWGRMYLTEDSATEVTVTEDDHALRFVPCRALGASAHRQLARRLRSHFPRQVASLGLGARPVLAALADRYQGVIVMHADPFEALILTVLSQNRTGEIVRRVYPVLENRCGGTTPGRIAALDERELREIIRPAGPYKAPRLAAVRTIAADGPGRFARTVTGAPGEQAMAYLTSLPGVAHKTAACVLVFAAQSDHTLPVDTHLFRVARRLGLASHDGTLTAATRDAIVSALLGYGPDLAPAHFLFLLLGRTTCTAGSPRCGDCFLEPGCPAVGVAPASSGAQGRPW